MPEIKQYEEHYPTHQDLIEQVLQGPDKQASILQGEKLVNLHTAEQRQAWMDKVRDTADADNTQWDIDHPKAPEPPTSLPEMDENPFQETEKAARELRSKFQRNELSVDQYKQQLRLLMVLDKNVWWMVGGKSGEWYKHVNDEWVPAQSPSQVESSAPAVTKTPEPSIATTEPVPVEPIIKPVEASIPAFAAPAQVPTDTRMLTADTVGESMPQPDSKTKAGLPEEQRSEGPTARARVIGALRQGRNAATEKLANSASNALNRVRRTTTNGSPEPTVETGPLSSQLPPEGASPTQGAEGNPFADLENQQTAQPDTPLPSQIYKFDELAASTQPERTRNRFGFSLRRRGNQQPEVTPPASNRKNEFIFDDEEENPLAQGSQSESANKPLAELNKLPEAEQLKYLSTHLGIAPRKSGVGIIGAARNINSSIGRIQDPDQLLADIRSHRSDVQVLLTDPKDGLAVLKRAYAKITNQ